MSSGHAVSMVVAIAEALFSLAFRLIKKLSVLIDGRAEICAVARSLNDAQLANVPLPLCTVQSARQAKPGHKLLNYLLLLLSH
jgi:hypothetical protein